MSDKQMWALIILALWPAHWTLLARVPRIRWVSSDGWSLAFQFALGPVGLLIELGWDLTCIFFGWWWVKEIDEGASEEDKETGAYR